MCQLQVWAGPHHLPRWPVHFASLPMLGSSSWAPRVRALDLTASPGSPDPHPAGQRPPGSPRALLTRAGSHTAELSLQLGTLAGLAAVLGGHAGPHPAPGPPPAAAGAQAPGAPLLPHAVHCKEARGRWLGGTLAPPTAHPPTNQELWQLCDSSSLALHWAPGLRPWRGGSQRHRLLVPAHTGYLLRLGD